MCIILGLFQDLFYLSTFFWNCLKYFLKFKQSIPLEALCNALISLFFVLFQMMKAIGNRNANDFWEYHLSPDKRINSDTSSATRMAHIEDKYKAKLYCDKSIISDNPRVLNEVDTCTLHRGYSIVLCRIRKLFFE